LTAPQRMHSMKFFIILCYIRYWLVLRTGKYNTFIAVQNASLFKTKLFYWKAYGVTFFFNNCPTGHFSAKFCHSVALPDHNGSNDTGLKSLWPPGAESIAGHTDTQIRRRNKDIILEVLSLNIQKDNKNITKMNESVH
jgi:hypothetical protein